MKSNTTVFWRAFGKNLALSVGLVTLLFLVIARFNLLTMSTPTLICSILSSISGIAYILTIRNPQNYTGFYAGIFSTALLGVQFFLAGSYDLTFFYFALFVPFMTLSLYSWKKGSCSDTKQAVVPRFLPLRKRLQGAGIFLLLVIADYLFATFCLSDSLSAILKLINGVLIASCVLANWLLIKKYTDSWLYWLLYSIAGILFGILCNNYFNVVLFSFFLLINGLTFMAWLKSGFSPNDSYKQSIS
ncbi:MAG: nicotinamide mononucleotide transporter family protein [Prevotellaceae bacterium]|jgi:nicotinamide riboside transporter PnuC|nr:nicotinamide mononucleotide transporter family protein [Prevotellaceae bacterium]